VVQKERRHMRVDGVSAMTEFRQRIAAIFRARVRIGNGPQFDFRFPRQAIASFGNVAKTYDEINHIKRYRV
jgi:hypothetical protein